MPGNYKSSNNTLVKLDSVDIEDIINAPLREVEEFEDPAGGGGGGDAVTLEGEDGAHYLDTDNHTAGITNELFTGTEKTKLSGIATAATANDTDAELRDTDTHTDGTTNKVYTAVEKTKLAGIATAATANATNAQLRDTDTHTDGSTNHVFTAADDTKLTGIATSATANDTDANLKARANHTGTQLASTISDFTTAVGLLRGVNYTGTVTTRTATVVGAATEATFATVSIPDDAIAAGDTIDFEVWGDLLANATTDNVTYRFKVGASTILTSGPAAITANAAIRRFSMKMRIFFTSPSAQLVKGEMNATTAGVTASDFKNVAGSAYPTGIAHAIAAANFSAGPTTLSMTVEWATANASQTITPVALVAVHTRA